MTVTSGKSVDVLRQESERTRAELATTVGALREQVGDTAAGLKTLVSPQHIKQEIKDYVRQERVGLIDAVQRKARENPLQMAAIGAAVAYPALSLLRSVPKPLWLIGAGLFLTSKRGQQAASDMRAKMDGAVEQASEQVTELATSIQSNVEDRLTGARHAAAGARNAASAKVGSLTDQARAAFHDARDAVAGTAGQVSARLRSETSAQSEDLAGAGAETAESLKHRAAGMAKSSRNTVADFAMQNPLLVAGVGAAVGALIAASIPPSDAENRLFGSRSGKLKDRASEALADGIEGASDAIAGAAGAATSAATREGLDGSGVQDRLNKVAGSVRRVADRGLDAALGGAPQQEQQGQQEQSEQQPMTERNPT